MTRGHTARRRSGAAGLRCIGLGLAPLNSSAVSIDLIDPIDRRLEVGVLYPLRPRETQQPAEPTEAVIHHHDFSAAATARLRANPPAGSRGHAASRYPHGTWWAGQR